MHTVACAVPRTSVAEQTSQLAELQPPLPARPTCNTQRSFPSSEPALKIQQTCPQDESRCLWNVNSSYCTATASQTCQLDCPAGSVFASNSRLLFACFLDDLFGTWKYKALHLRQHTARVPAKASQKNRQHLLEGLWSCQPHNCLRTGSVLLQCGLPCQSSTQAPVGVQALVARVN